MPKLKDEICPEGYVLLGQWAKLRQISLARAECLLHNMKVPYIKVNGRRAIRKDQPVPETCRKRFLEA